MKVIPHTGWLLVGREEDPETGLMQKTGPYYIAWGEMFHRKHEALRFIKQNKWPPGFRAVRGKMSALSTSKGEV